MNFDFQYEYMTAKTMAGHGFFMIISMGCVVHVVLTFSHVLQEGPSIASHIAFRCRNFRHSDVGEV